MELPKVDRLEERAAGHAADAYPLAGRSVKAESQEIQAFYEFSDDAVERFLRDYPFLAALLIDAVQPLRRHFPDARLALDLVEDAEVANDRQLALAVLSSRPTDELLKSLQAFDDEWWLDCLPRAEDRLFITLGFE